ncbi:MAG TPA: aldo/keto reductase [Gemmatimonadaceae bacterium]
MPTGTTHSSPAGDGEKLTPPRTSGAQKFPRATTDGTLRLATRNVRHPADFYRTVPRALTASALGLGTYLGECTDAEDDRYRKSIREALGSGINVIDTAINYRCQRSERAVGSALSEALSAGEIRRDEVLVCSKGGYVALDGEPPTSREAYETFLEETLFVPGLITPNDLARGGHSIHPRFLMMQLERSMENLGLDCIDLYYLHNPEEQLLAVDQATFRGRLRTAFELLEERAMSGAIGGYGCATWLGLRVPPDNRQHLSLSDLVALARDIGGPGNHFRVVQLPFGLGMPEAARNPTQRLGGKLVPLFEAAEALGLGVVVSGPLMQGRLVADLPDEVRALFPTCTTDAQRSLRFAASLSAVSTVLTGMRRTEHVRENVAAWRQVMA